MRIKSFEQFVLNEGGKVFDDTQRINREFIDDTVKDIEEKLFKPNGLKLGKNVIRLGSAGHTETSGDIDFGIIGKPLSELSDKIPNSNFIKGLEVLSVEWPIAGSNGLVQVDMIPVYDREWADFVYAYPKGSRYKSAHRNWALMAVLSSIKNNIETDESGNIVSYDGYMMNLNKGLFSMKKDYRGKTKILKHAPATDEKLITTNPIKFVEFVFGKNYKPEDTRTFEDCWHIITSDSFKWTENVEDIKKNLIKFLKRVELPIPKEL